MFLRRKWGVAVEGSETGTIQSLRWMRFWSRSTADQWVARMNETAADKGSLVRYVVVER